MKIQYKVLLACSVLVAISLIVFGLAITGNSKHQTAQVFVLYSKRWCAYVVDGQKECAKTGLTKAYWIKPAADEHYDEEDGVSKEEAALVALFRYEFVMIGSLSGKQRAKADQIIGGWETNNPSNIVADYDNGFTLKATTPDPTATSAAKPTAKPTKPDASPTAKTPKRDKPGRTPTATPK